MGYDILDITHARVPNMSKRKSKTDGIIADFKYPEEKFPDFRAFTVTYKHQPALMPYNQLVKTAFPLGKLLKKYTESFTMIPELTEAQRIHYHCLLIINSEDQMIKFRKNCIPYIMKNLGFIKLREVKDLDGWTTYMKKERKENEYVFSKNDEIQNITIDDSNYDKFKDLEEELLEEDVRKQMRTIVARSPEHAQELKDAGLEISLGSDSDSNESKKSLSSSSSSDSDSETDKPTVRKTVRRLEKKASMAGKIVRGKVSRIKKA